MILLQEPLIEYEHPRIIKILGVRYTVEFFECFAETLQDNQLFKFVKRDKDGVVVIERMGEKE